MKTKITAYLLLTAAVAGCSRGVITTPEGEAMLTVIPDHRSVCTWEDSLPVVPPNVPCWDGREPQKPLVLTILPRG